MHLEVSNSNNLREMPSVKDWAWGNKLRVDQDSEELEAQLTGKNSLIISMFPSRRSFPTAFLSSSSPQVPLFPKSMAR